MMRIRGVWTTNAVAALLGFGMYASFILLPEYVETPARAGYGFGASVSGAGLFLVPSTIAMLIAGAQTGRLEKRFGSKPPLLAGAALTSASYVLLALASTERWEIYLAALLLGAGIGFAFASMVNLIIENVGPTETGVATGMNTVTRTVGGAFGGAAVASILASSVGASRLSLRARVHDRIRRMRARARARLRGRTRDSAAAPRRCVRAARDRRRDHRASRARLTLGPPPEFRSAR